MDNFGEVNGIPGIILAPGGEHAIFKLPHVRRFELNSGSITQEYISPTPGATLHIQDNGRTLKVFESKPHNRAAYYLAAEELTAYSDESNGIYLLSDCNRFELFLPKILRSQTLKEGASVHVEEGGQMLRIFTADVANLGEWFNRKHDWGKDTRERTSNGQ